MKIISKCQVMVIYCQYLQFWLFFFCMGKYKWFGSICYYVGQEVQDISGVFVVFVECCQNCNGFYVVLCSVMLN